MNFPKSGPPSSRIAKKQVTVYLSPDLDAIVRHQVHSKGDTLQQFLGKALNAELESRGIAPFISTRKQHIFVRTKNPAKARDDVSTPGTRRGRRLIAGWFDRNEVNRLTALCAELGTSIQDLGEAGLERITTLKAAE